MFPSPWKLSGGQVSPLSLNLIVIHSSTSSKMKPELKCIWIPGAVIIGAGPSGLASAACLRQKGIPFLVLEKEICLASLWKVKTYDHLRLHLPKKFCELPYMSFPQETPLYPAKHQFISYLESYAKCFSIAPMFRQEVKSATYDSSTFIWHVETTEFEFLCRWLIVATGENAVPVMPEIPGLKDFKGTIMHTSNYKNGTAFRGRKVLVVGFGNSGMEVCLDLCRSGAHVTLLARHKEVGTLLDGNCRNIVFITAEGNVAASSGFGIDRPKTGPLELKNATGKTPVLDIGAIAKIRSGEIKVVHDIHRLVSGGVEFVEGNMEEYESIILATGYRTNITSWLKRDKCHPESQNPHCWKGKCGLYSVGFSRQGLLEASREARTVAEDIARQWSSGTKP